MEWRKGARVREFFSTQNPNLKKSCFFFLFFLWGGGGWWMDGQSNRPKPILPFNFFEVWGITMLYCTSYVPDKLNL